MRNLLPFLLFLHAPDGAGGAAGDKAGTSSDTNKKAEDKTGDGAADKAADTQKPDAALLSKLAELEKWKADQEEAVTKAKEEEAKKKGEWEKLANDRETEAKTLKEKLALYEKAEKAREDAAKADLEAALKELPKEVAELIPSGTNQDRLLWLQRAQKAGLIGGDEKPAGTRTQGSSGRVVVPDDIKKYAEERGLDPATYFLTTQKKNKEGAGK